MSLLRCLVACFSAIAVNAGAAIVPAWVVQATSGEVTSIVVAGGDPLVAIAQRRGAEPIRSVDGGTTWAPFTVSGVRPDKFVASPTDRRVFYAVAGGVAGPAFFSSGPSALYRSSDGGASWERITPSLITPMGAPLGNVVVGATPDLLFASRMAPSICQIGCAYEGVELFVSQDAGRSWRSVDPGPVSLGRFAYPAASDSRVAYAVTRGGLYRSGDQGASWILVHAASTVDIVYEPQVVVDRRDAAIVYARFTGGTQWRVTEDGGETWRTSPPVNVPGGQAPRLLADPADAGRAFYVGWEGEAFETRDAARTWKRVTANAGTLVFTDPDGPQVAVGASNDKRVLFGGAFSVKTVVVEPDSMALGSDLWWNPNESGRGWAITQHASGNLFVVWYLYDPQNEKVPMWRMVSGGNWIDSRTFTGKLHAVQGAAFFERPYDPSRVAATEIGTATLRFADDRTATFSYRLSDGAEGVKDISRFDFGPPSASLFMNFADLWWSPDAPGWGLSVSHQFGSMFLSWYVYDEQGNPTWLTVPSATYGFLNDGPLGYRPRYQGTIYRTEGAGFPVSGIAGAVTNVAVGSASITFNTRAEAEFTYTVQGVSWTRRLNRLPF